MSSTWVAFSSPARKRPSVRTRRPSASVLSTITDLPFLAVKMSPGRWAFASGRFSAQQRIPTTFTSGFSRPSARRLKSTAAAPAMSPFISHILSPGFRLMPPESKVIPLPTSAIVSFEGLRGHVAQDDHARRVGAPLADVEEPLVAAGLEPRGVQDLDLQIQLLGDFARALRDHLRRHHRPRLVDEVARSGSRSPRPRRSAPSAPPPPPGDRGGPRGRAGLLGQELVLLLAGTCRRCRPRASAPSTALPTSGPASRPFTSRPTLTQR